MPPTTSRNHRYLALQDESSTIARHHQRPSTLKRTLTSIAYFLPVALFIAGLLLLSLLTRNINSTSQDYGCDPEGKVWVTKANRPNRWSHTYGLAITLGFGEFTFTEAKAVDIAWDLTIGRGAQVLSAILVYYVFRGPVVEMMRTNGGGGGGGVPYKKVVQMQYHTGGFESWLTYCRDVTRKKRTRFQYFAALMLAVSTGYVLIMPTLIDSMTGYQPIAVPLLMLANDTFIYYDALFRCAYVIQDGPRIGLESMACVERGSAMASAIAGYIEHYITYNYTGGWTGNASPTSAADHSSMLRLPGHERHRRTPSPYLNMTISHFQDPDHIVFYNGRFLSVDYLYNNGWCAPQPTFQWGFSLILLFMFLAITFLVGALMYAVWLGHCWTDRNHPDEAKEVFGNLKTTLAVGEAIREELGADVAKALTDDGLKRALDAKGVGMTLRMKDGPEDEIQLRTDIWRSPQPSPRLR